MSFIIIILIILYFSNFFYLEHTYEDLAHHSFTYFAAFNTIPTQLGFVLYMLALHPDVQRKLRQEIKETVDKELEVLEKMKYLDAVVYGEFFLNNNRLT